MRVGDRVTEKVSFGDSMPKPMAGTVVWIHPRRIFYVAEFELAIGKFRESYFFPTRRGDAK